MAALEERVRLLEERVRLLEERVAVLAEAIRVLAEGWRRPRRPNPVSGPPPTPPGAYDLLPAPKSRLPGTPARAAGSGDSYSRAGPARELTGWPVP